VNDPVNAAVKTLPEKQLQRLELTGSTMQCFFSNTNKHNLWHIRNVPSMARQDLGDSCFQN